MNRFLLLFILASLLLSCNGPSLIKNKNEQGQLIDQYFINQDSLLHGLKTSFHLNGKVHIEENYINGKMTGPRTIYDTLGIVEIKEQYKSDTIVGPYYVYYPNGQLKMEANYVQGSMEGMVKTYYENGAYKEEVTIVNNEENGPFKEYHPNGKVSWEGTYVNGDNEIGELLQFDDEGNLIKKMQCDTFMNFSKCQTIWKIDTNNDESTQ